MRSCSALVALVLLLPACDPTPLAPDAGGDASAPDAPMGDAAARSCFTDADCNDGIYCNGTEACTTGHCTRTPVDCDDGIACTRDICSENTHECVSRAADEDADGFGDASCHDNAGIALGSDCDDTDPTVFPGNPEICNLLDEDCDPTTLGGGDTDHDGAVPTTCCNPTATGMTCGRDCDDGNPSISQLATEICDTIDNDCDGMTDESTQMMSWPDVDLDGYGDASATPLVVCVVPSSRANQGGDCDDHAMSAHPLAVETCNDVDDDCDGHIDEGASTACGRPGSTMECIHGRCAVTGCDALHFDCNGAVSDGCEVSLCDSNPGCGACGIDCGSGIALCRDGQCAGTAELLANVFGSVRDAITGAPIAGATITSIDVCPASTTTTLANGSYQLEVRDHFRPRWVRIDAPGYPPHIQPVNSTASLFSTAVVDAWRADPDAATPASATRAILVIDGNSVTTEITHGTAPGPGNGYIGSDLSPFVGGDGTVFLGAQPGRQPIGGRTDLGGGCSSNCTPIYDLWLVPGAVTHIDGGFSCGAVC